jgi:hypothetical protein
LTAASAQLEHVLAPVVAWARSRSDILGLAVTGSWARGTARQDSDIDLVVLAGEPQAFRYDETWLADIHWNAAHVAGWHDADYGTVWSRHVRMEPPCEVEFTFCGRSWTATDPVDPGTASVVANGFRVLLDKARLFEKLLAAISP